MISAMGSRSVLRAKAKGTPARIKPIQDGSVALTTYVDSKQMRFLAWRGVPGLRAQVAQSQSCVPKMSAAQDLR
jgi:hypothetical protein